MSDLNGTDPLKIAIEIEKGLLWLSCPREHRNFNGVCPDEYTKEIVIAALRAYYVHAHNWDDKQGQTWWWSTDEKLWMRRCLSCNVTEGHARLVPEGEKDAD